MRAARIFPPRSGRRPAAQGVDVAIDNVGSQLFEPIRRSMGIGGRWILIGQLTGQFVPFNPAQLFLKNVSMLSATSTTRRQLEDCLALVARGAVKPIVSLALPLEQAAQAHELMEAGKAAGRIVLRPNGWRMKVDAAIVGIGCSAFGRGLPDSQLRLAAVAFREALADAGLERERRRRPFDPSRLAARASTTTASPRLRARIRYVNQSGCTAASSPMRCSMPRSRCPPGSPTSSPA